MATYDGTWKTPKDEMHEPRMTRNSMHDPRITRNGMHEPRITRNSMHDPRITRNDMHEPRITRRNRSQPQNYDTNSMMAEINEEMLFPDTIEMMRIKSHYYLDTMMLLKMIYPRTYYMAMQAEQDRMKEQSYQRPQTTHVSNSCSCPSCLMGGQPEQCTGVSAVNEEQWNNSGFAEQKVEYLPNVDCTVVAEGNSADAITVTDLEWLKSVTMNCQFDNSEIPADNLPPII